MKTAQRSKMKWLWENMKGYRALYFICIFGKGIHPSRSASGYNRKNGNSILRNYIVKILPLREIVNNLSV